jgi:hypothetical protein
MGYGDGDEKTIVSFSVLQTNTLLLILENPLK